MNEPSERAMKAARWIINYGTTDAGYHNPHPESVAAVIDREFPGYEALLDLARELSLFRCPGKEGHRPCRLCDLLKTGASALAAAKVKP